MKLKSIFLFSVGVLLAGRAYLFAQPLPVIVKDYNNCTVGLQDRSGNWIAAPVYTGIQPFSYKRAVMIRDGRFGLLNPKGKEVIPAEWETVTLTPIKYRTGGDPYFGSYTHLYTCKKDNRTAVIDSTGKVLVDVLYNLGAFSDSVAAGKDSSGHWHFVSLNGTVVHLPQAIQTEPVLLISHLYSFRYDTTIVGKGKQKTVKKSSYGVMNSKGEIIIAPVYQWVEIFAPPFPVIRADSGKYVTWYNTEGRVVIGPTQNPAMRVMRNPFWYSGKAAIEENGKYGLITWSGDTLVDALYDTAPDEILPDVYSVYVNGRYGIISDSGKANIPAMYKSLQLLNHPYNTMATRHFLAQSDSGWNIIDSQGKRLLERDQDTVFHPGRRMIFIHGGEIAVMEYAWSNASVGMSQKMYNEWFPDGQGERYPHYILDEVYPRSDNDTIVHYNQEWIADDRMGDQGISRRGKKKRNRPPVNPYPYLIVNRPAIFLRNMRPDTLPSGLPGYTVHMIYTPEEYRYYSEMIAVTGKDSSGTIEVFSIQSLTENYSQFSSKDHTGLMHNSGRIVVPPGQFTGFSFPHETHNVIQAWKEDEKSYLLDTTGSVICQINSTNVRFHQPGTIWISQYDSASADYYNCAYQWNLYDYQNRKYLLDTALHITEPFSPDAGDQLLYTQSGIGVINTANRHILVKPVYSRVIQIDAASRYFAVSTCTGKTGVIDSSGNFIGDTIYDGFAKIHGSAFYNSAGRTSRPLTADDVYLFYNFSDSFALFKGNGSFELIDSADYHNVLMLLMDEGLRKERHGNDQCAHCNATLTLHTHPLRPWQDSLLFYSIFSHCHPSAHDYSSQRRENSCMCPPPLYHPRLSARYNYSGLQSVTVFFLTDSLIAYAHQSGPAHENWFSRSFICRNVVFTAEGPQTVTLDSLFIGQAWRSVIIDSVLAYLQHHPGINANCSDPTLYPKMLNEKFLLQSDGLYLYPDWSRMTNGETLPSRPFIRIPWATINPHLRPEIKTKIRR